MTEIWEHQQLPRSEIEKMREEVQLSSVQLDDSRRKLVDKEKRIQEESEK